MQINPERHLLKHPFYQEWMRGTLSKATLIDYSEQYFHHVEAFPAYLSTAIASIPSSNPIGHQARSVLSENLAEEDGTTYGTSHPELWLRFAEGLGARREAVLARARRPGIDRVVNFFTTASKTSLPQALGALYAYESQVPEVATSKIDGLKNNYGIHDERTLSFFEIHRSADVHHRESLLQLINALPPVEKIEAEQAAAGAAQALWDFLTEVCEHNGISCATLAS